MFWTIVGVSVFWVVAFVIFERFFYKPKTLEELETIRWFRKKLARDFKEGSVYFSHLAHAEKMTAEEILNALGEEMEIETDRLFNLPYREAFLNVLAKQD